MKEPRAYFINYVAPMIKNYLNCSTCDDLHSYIIILEKNKNDMYIISSYLIDEPGYLQNVLKEYNKYKKVS